MDNYLKGLKQLDRPMLREAIYKPFPDADKAKSNDLSELDIDNLDLTGDNVNVKTFKHSENETFLQQLDMKRFWHALQNSYSESGNHAVDLKNEEKLLNDYQSPIPLLIYGDPGISKSAQIHDFAKYTAKNEGKEFLDWDKIPIKDKIALVTAKDLDKKFIFIDFRVADKLPEDFGGIPQPSRDIIENIDASIPFELRLYPLAWTVLRRRNPKTEGPNARGMIFLDELNQGILPTLFALYKLVLDNKVGELALSPFLFKVAAGNYEGTSANGIRQLPEALASRFKTAYLVADWPSFLEWAQGKNDRNQQRIDNDILEFIGQEPEQLFNIKPKDYEGKEGAKYPNPRNIERFSRQYVYLKKKYREKKETTSSFMKDLSEEGTMTVGPDFTKDFLYFLRSAKLYDTESVRNMKPEEYAEKPLGEKLGLIRWIKNGVWFALNDNVPLKDRAKSFEAIVNAFHNLSPEKKTILLQDLHQVEFISHEDAEKTAKALGQHYGVPPTLALKLIAQLTELVKKGTLSNPRLKETMKVNLPHPEFAKEFLKFVEDSRAIKEL